MKPSVGNPLVVRQQFIPYSLRLRPKSRDSVFERLHLCVVFTLHGAVCRVIRCVIRAVEALVDVDALSVALRAGSQRNEIAEATLQSWAYRRLR
jgi:hypothetical protein